ncbi:MAG: outer membrane lipoprotein carrier protein LolA [Flavobacteriaceae bacterium]|nr:outer membrane lipoprotein carrier protein LolA [Flavobacteriaceae bacterium]
MKKINSTLFFTLTILFSSITFAQEAKDYLKKVSEQAKSYSSIYIEFDNKLDNAEANVHQSTSGFATIQGDLYNFNYLETERFFDGEKIYTILQEDEEVIITSPEKNEEDVIITPSNILSFYEHGFTYEMDIIQNIQNKKIQFIKLTPTDSESELKTILLGINTATKNIFRVIQNGKDGNVTTITISTIKTNKTVSPQLFTFDRSKFETAGYYITEPK